MTSTCVACIWIEKIGIAVEHRRLPDTLGAPVVLMSPDGKIQVASLQAEQRGVTAGMEISVARSLCGDLRVLPYDRPAYESAAHPIWDAIATESDTVEPVSPEICYAAAPGTLADVTARLTRLTEVIAPLIDLPIRMAIARSKFAALHAAQVRAPETLRTITFGEEVRFLSHLTLDHLLPYLPKLDIKARKRLETAGVRTLGDVWALPPTRLPRALQRLGHQMLQLAQGFDSDPVRPLWPPRSLTARTSFAEESDDGAGYPDGVDDLSVIDARLGALAERIATQLAAQQEYTREVALRVELQDGSFLAESERLVMPEAQAAPLRRAALRLLQHLRIEQPLLTLELVASELGAGSGVQLSLMDQAGELPHERRKRLDAAIAFLRKKYGPRVLITGSLLRNARRIDLWTYSLARYQSESLDQVATDAQGNPLRYWRQQNACKRRLTPNHASSRRYDVLRVHNRWRETRLQQGALTDTDIWRVETDPSGVSDVQHLDGQWRLKAIFD